MPKLNIKDLDQSKIKNIADLDPSKIKVIQDVDSVVPDEEPVDTSMGAPEAFSRHFGYSASLGASDPVTAGICALMPRSDVDTQLEKEGFKLPSRRDEYYAAKKGLVEGREKASCDQMLASTLGIIGGGVASPIPGAIVGKLGKVGQMAETVLPNMKGYKLIGRLKDARDAALAAKQMEKAEKLQTMLGHVSRIKAAKEGAKAGAAFGLFGGDAKLLEGDVKGTAKEAASGAALGAFVGGTVDSALTGLGYRYEKHPTIFKNLIVEPMKKGFQKLRLNEAATKERSEALITEQVKKVAQMQRQVGKEYDVIEKFAADQKITFDNKESITKLKQAIDKVEQPEAKARLQSALKVLKPYFDDIIVDVKEPRELVAMRKHISDRAAKAGTEGERLAILEEGKALEKAIKSGRENLGSEEYVVQGEEMLPGARSSTKAQVRKDMIEQDILDAEGKVVGSETGEIISPKATTDFVPTDLEHVIDPITGRPVASYKDAGKGQLHRFHGTPDAPVTPTTKINPEKMSLQQTKELEHELKRLQYPGEGKLSDLGTVTPVMGETLEQMGKERISGLGKMGPKAIETNTKYNAAKQARDMLGLKDTVREEDITAATHGIYDKVTTNNTAQYNEFARDLGDQLNKIDPALSKKVLGVLEQSRQDFFVNRDAMTGRTGLAPRSIGTISAAIREVANALGRAAGTVKDAGKSIFQVGAKVGKQALDHKSLSVIKAPAAKIDQMIQKLSGNPKAKEAMNALLKAKESPDQTRAAIMFGLYQQPWFREAIKEEEDGQNE